MEIKKYNPQIDYSIVQSLFKDWNWACIDKESISPHSYFVVNDGEIIMFSGYYEFVGVKSGLMGITVSKKEISKELRNLSVDTILNYIFAECEDKGFKYLIYTTDEASKSMINRFIDKGAIVADDGGAYTVIKEFNGSNSKFYWDE